MGIASVLHLRTRRAVLTAGGAALVGCATLGVITLGVANAQPSSTPPPTVSTAGNATYVTMDSAQLKQQQDKFISTLATRLGVSSDKLQQSLKDTQQEVGPVPLMLGMPTDAVGIKGKTVAISMSSELSAAAKVIGISEDQLRQEVDGKSLDDVARAHNIDLQKVASAIKSAREASLDKEVEMLMSMVRPAGGGFAEAGASAVRIVLKNAPAP
jgi:hypothetical protein